MGSIMNQVTESPAATCDVLIVEDEYVQAREVAHALAKAGLTVRIARDAVSTFQEVKTCRPRVALIDCNLPDSNGFLIAQKFQDLSPGTAIIFMSGQIDGVPESLLQATAGRAFINKPVPLGALRSAILKLLRNQEFGADRVPEKHGWLLSGTGSPRAWKNITPDKTG